MASTQEHVARQRGGLPRRLVLAALLGLATGMAATGAGVAVGAAVLLLSSMSDSPCDSDLACLPDLGPLILVVCLFPLLLAVVGPVVAHLLRIPRPGLFLIPVVWAGILVCVGLGPSAGQDHWPYNDLISCVLILWVPYSLIAVGTTWHAAAKESVAPPAPPAEDPVQ